MKPRGEMTSARKNCQAASAKSPPVGSPSGYAKVMMSLKESPFNSFRHDSKSACPPRILLINAGLADDFKVRHLWRDRTISSARESRTRSSGESASTTAAWLCSNAAGDMPSILGVELQNALAIAVMAINHNDANLFIVRTQNATVGCASPRSAEGYPVRNGGRDVCASVTHEIHGLTDGAVLVIH